MKAVDHHNNNKIAPPLFSFVLVFSVIVAVASPPIAGVPHLDVSPELREFTCSLFPQLLAIGTIVVATVFLTTFYRILQIFKAKELDTVTISIRELGTPVGCALVAHLAVMLTWGILNPSSGILTATRDDKMEMMWTCDFNANLLLFIDFAMIGGEIGVGIWIGFVIRAAPRWWRRIRFILYALVLMATVFSFILPAALISYNPMIRYLLISLVVIVGSAGVLFFVLGQKVEQVYIMTNRAKSQITSQQTNETQTGQTRNASEPNSKPASPYARPRFEVTQRGEMDTTRAKEDEDHDRIEIGDFARLAQQQQQGNRNQAE
jgi:hypothetical protein